MTETIQDGPWKLIIIYGTTSNEPTKYQLFHLEHDPDQKENLAEHCEQILFKLQGRLEKK